MKLSKKIALLIKAPKSGAATLRGAYSESKGVQLLSGVLVLQLVVAGGLLWKSNSQAEFAPATQLVNVDSSTINEIVIDDGKGRVTLTNVDDQWRLDDENKTLAASDKIKQLISDISELKPGLPVASTIGSHQQLEVSGSDFQRHVTLKNGGETVVELYMGTSPGFRKSHVRLADQDQVYAAKLNTFDVAVKKDDWLDKNLLAFESVDGVQSEGIELTLTDERWVLVKPEDQTKSHEVDQGGVASLVSRLNSLRVTSFAEPLKADEPSDEASSADESEQVEIEQLLTHSIVIAHNGAPVRLVLSRKGSQATIERSDIKGLFVLPVATYEGLTTDAIQQLIVEKIPENAKEADLSQG